MPLELADDTALLELVDLDDGGEELEVVAGVPGQLLERVHVLRETRPPEANPGPQEVRADAVVEPHPLCHDRHVRPDLLAHVRDLVDERDLGGEEGIRAVLDHLG